VADRAHGDSPPWAFFVLGRVRSEAGRPDRRLGEVGQGIGWQSILRASLYMLWGMQRRERKDGIKKQAQVIASA
jgi:hypothetical protein